MNRINIKMLTNDTKIYQNRNSCLQGFVRVREAHQRELIEDYIELIADLIQEYGEARQVELAARLGVAQPTVSKMLKRLVASSLIKQEKYHSVSLTTQGKKLASENHIRHQIVEAFLIALGVSKNIAQQDAEGIEHHVSSETLLAFSKFKKIFNEQY